MQWILIAGALHAALGNASSFFAAFAQAAAPLVVTALWQGAAIAAVLTICLRLAPRISAAHRFAVWAAAFVVVAGLPLLSLLAHFASTSIASASALHAAPAKPWLQFDLDSRWALVLAALWIVASALRAAQLAFHSLRLHKLWKSATPVAVDGNLRSVLAADSPARSLEICTTAQLDRPGVIGFFSPRILIPDWLFARLTPGELEQVVLHEAEHLRRGDDWINLLQKFALVLFPLNPGLAWIESRLCREREMACDEGVVHRTRAPRAYAACLTSLAERGRQRRLERRAEALSLGAWQRRPELARRVHCVLGRKQFLHPLAARTLVGVVGCGLLATSVEMARCPQMVAFVPAAKSTARNVTLAQADRAHKIRASYATVSDMNLERGAGGFRAIDTKLTLPESHRATTPLAAGSSRPTARQAAGLEDREIASSETQDNAPHQVLLKAELPAHSASRPSQSKSAQQYMLIFTTWEQVRSGSQRPALIADYDSNYDSGATPSEQAADQPSDQNQADTQNQPATQSSQPAMQYIVTRLIVRIEPAIAANSADATKPAATPAKSQASHEFNSASDQQSTAIPMGNGWLVFQL